MLMVCVPRKSTSVANNTPKYAKYRTKSGHGLMKRALRKRSESSTSAGANYIHVTEPEVTEPAFGENGRTLTELADRYSETAIVTNGGLGGPEKARTELADGADLVTQATAELANHDWPNRIRQGEEPADLDPSVIFEPDASISAAEVPNDD
jgi:2,4-dienoyl-CoA reductase-like NADH-dependent reductase (Old Yellow Enzyme family)